MKTIKLIIAGAAIACSLTAGHANPPLLTLTGKSLTEFEQTVGTFAKALDPGSDQDHARDFTRELGVTEQTPMARNQPFQIALWFEGGQPLIAVKVPTDDIAAFRDGLSPEGKLSTAGQLWESGAKGVGVIAMRGRDSLGESEAAALDEWMKTPPTKPNRPLRLGLKLNETARAMAIQMLLGVKGQMDQTFDQPQMKEMGINAQAMSTIMGVYFDILQMFVRGFDAMDLDLGVNNDIIEIDERIVPVADTEFARWMQRPSERITPAELASLDPNAFLSGVARIGNLPALGGAFRKLIIASYQMQNLEIEASLIDAFEDLMKSMFPLSLSGSVYLGHGLEFSGAYGFSRGEVRNIYSRMTELYDQAIAGQVGEDKMYASAELIKDHHRIHGVAVDRYTMVINPDSPMFSMPGQKEQMETMFPGGKIQIDYAIQGQRLLFASPGKMEALLEPGLNVDPAFAKSIRDTTSSLGYLNFLQMIKTTVGGNPMMPQEVKDKMARLNPEGTAIRFQADVDGQLDSKAWIPMKLLREMRKLGD